MTYNQEVPMYECVVTVKGILYRTCQLDVSEKDTCFHCGAYILYHGWDQCDDGEDIHPKHLWSADFDSEWQANEFIEERGG